MALRNEQERKYGPLRFFRSGNLCNGADSWPGLFMNELLRSPIAAKRRASQAGVLLRVLCSLHRKLQSNSQASCRVLSVLAAVLSHDGILYGADS